MARGRASRRVVRAVAGTATLGLLATGLGLGTGAGTASAAPGDKPGKGQSDVRHIGGDISSGKPLPLSKEGAGGSGSRSDEFKVGTVRKWPALDDKNDVNYTKQFVLRGIGDNVEVWVAKDIAFPAGDCRNQVGGGEGVVVTDEQVASFVKEFDSNIYPVESKVFSVTPTRTSTTCPREPSRATATGSSRWWTTCVTRTTTARLHQTARPTSRASTTRCSTSTPTAT